MVGRLGAIKQARLYGARAAATCGKPTWCNSTRGVDIAKQGATVAAGGVHPNAVADAHNVQL
eukprot:scaffold5333_cov49-Attheya_sp.AAC.3